ncbi:ParB/RepB/Spo0J family partition protein [Pedobacter chitinilyticus]|uniref:ParB/RepB/Spo0J family partition protein n=1 Tax=Pedobacter chitinilyticus TaxID=2233776 RepID=A0A3S3SUX2_9SPHI|nr:ParB/RepB/Spo0J family partition protein [Pedobacter chitinilyticus]RWU08183.1 ParB/RepB/Spo0J family partition protein [Pedobacter chitinilyticus]
MTTKTKTRRQKVLSRTAVPPGRKTDQPQTADNYLNIATNLIDISPLNHRKYYDEDALKSFGTELKQHGIISPIMVRIVKPGRYELVAGERRFRASKLADLQTMPAVVRELTDEQVIEIQLAENIQREDPHPLHEAQGIAQLQTLGLSIEEISARLGRSRKYIFGRIRLASLIEPLQLIFLAGKFSLADANAIAAISADGQQEFFKQECRNWQKKEFRIYNLSGILNQYRYDLKRAPFDTKNKMLVPEAGACTKCQFNTAVLKELFPEEAKSATCTNKTCYQSKCSAHFNLMIASAVSEHQPIALITGYNVSERTLAALKASPLTRDLPIHQADEITIFEEPVMPTKEDFTDPWAQDDDEDAEFDQEGFEVALQEHQAELLEFQQIRERESTKIGLRVWDSSVKAVLFNTERPRSARYGSAASVTSKQVQEAIKNGTATVELLIGEVARLKGREERAKQIDRDKVQAAVHHQFAEHYQQLEHNLEQTDADTCALRLLIFEGLDYHSRNKVKATIFDQQPDEAMDEQEATYQALCNLTLQQHLLLVRMALAAKPESKLPRSQAAYTLYKVAEQSGLDVVAIENAQQEIAEARKARMETKVALLDKKVERLQQVTLEAE